VLEWFKELNPVLQALLATLFTWGVTAVGAATVFLAKTINQKVLGFMLAFAGGVMMTLDVALG
jgi:ZIP family zinc transporter